MKLKEKIVLKAVSLFNEKGIANVSPNLIASVLEISVGNLTYHFKTKALLVKAIYERMHEESEDFISVERYFTLDDFRKVMLRFQELQEKYSFFFNDVVFITRNYSEVGQLYEASNILRFKKGRKLIDYYIETERMLPEENGTNYNYFIHATWMLSAFWTAQDNIITEVINYNKPTSSVELTWQMLLPYLTKKGKDEYFQISKLYNKQFS